MSVQSKVRSIVLSKTTTTAIEAEIGAVITAEEALGFVLSEMTLFGNTVTMTFLHNSVMPGGGGTQELKLSFDFAALSAAALTKLLPFALVPASFSPILASVNVTIAFAGPAVSALGLELGDTADPNGLLASVDLLTTGVKGVGGAAYHGAVQNAMAPEALATAVGANLDVLTQGVAEAIVLIKKWA